ncbi:hypothetical protein Leryth_000879 [Lithospermum erythrorhizon]|nr:hypothetical protein Leryth_000879 [Lithospermum erythrorhizon]
MEDSEHIDLDNNGFNLIDFSSENDSLFFIVSPISHQPNSAGFQGDSTGFETVGDTDSGNGNDQIETAPELAQSGEPQRIRSGKCNLRKSLAWDNEFFTSAGVLDSEELTSMMNGREAVRKQFLPGIQEDMQRSTDSISTLESDNFTLECLEAELFEDIRASIQKSSLSAKGSFGTKAIVQGAQNGDTVSQNQLKSIPVIKKAIGMDKVGCQTAAG